jgi:hypothetical protein
VTAAGFRAGRLALAFSVALQAPGGVAAQTPWRTSYFPYPIGNPTDGAMLIARIQRVKDAPYFLPKSGERDVVNPLSFSGAWSAEAGAGTLGSWVVRSDFRAPGLVPGWRFQASVAAERTGHLGFYDLGGGFVDLPDARAEGANDDFFRVHRRRFFAQAEATRQLTGRLRLALAARLDHTEFSPFSDSTLWLERFGRSSVSSTDLVIRPALVFDTRDREFVPANGALIEAGGFLGTAGSYGGAYAHARGYVSLRPGTVLAGRILFREMDSDAPLAPRLYVLGWEREMSTAGASGHRSFPLGAIASSRLVLGSVEVRHDLLNAGDFGAVTALGFVDYGFGRDPGFGRANAFGGGAGVALRVLRSAILTLNFAAGPNGFNFSMGNGWEF